MTKAVPLEAHEAGQPVPVLRPRLPQARNILPYLERIDQNRIYSNWGPLVEELSARLCEKLGLQPGGVICASSGMSALIGAILATAGRAREQRPLCIVPDFTFTATGLAVRLCGYEAVLASCETDAWTFEPDDLLKHPELMARVGLVVPVAPFGRSVNRAQWQHFQDRTGIPVVVDGAASIESLMRDRSNAGEKIPIALSFHATKSFSTGEGGAVMTADPVLRERTFQCLNFGFSGSRDSEALAINGKMSEFAAAVGLADLDGWAQKQSRTLAVFDTYREAFDRCDIKLRLWGPPSISSSYLLLQCDTEAQSETAATALARSAIDTRFWYGDGLGAHSVFANCQTLQLPSGKKRLISKTLLGLPVAEDLPPAQIRRIAETISAALA